MLKTFKNKGLKELFEKGQSRKINKQLHALCLRRLDVMDAATKPEDLDIPGFKFHTLHGNPTRYSIWVTGNYRITFEWDGQDAVRVDYEDYH